MKKLSKIYESLFNETIIDEDYPNSFNMEEFKSLTSFNKRIKYCEINLTKISSGSGRIVYQIDDTKVLKLAKNKKGIAQCEVEEEYSNYDEVKYITAQVYDSHPNSLWIEMELAFKLNSKKFENITGYKWNDFVSAMNYENERLRNQGVPKFNGISRELWQEMWDNEDGFPNEMFRFMANFDIPVGDLIRPSSYGIVKRNGEDAVVMIDYGLNNDVYDGYYR